MGKYIWSAIISLFIFCGISIGRKSFVKSYLEKEGKTIIKSEIKHFGKKLSINSLRKECRTTTKVGLRASLRVLTPAEKKVLKRIEKVVPYGNNGINAEKWTIGQIAKSPLFPKCIQNFKEYCSNNSISKETMDRILRDLGKSRKVVLPANKRQVDFTGISVRICKLPSTQELISHLGGQEAIKKMSDKTLKMKIRDFHYNVAWNAFAKKYKITPEQAKDIFGLLDHAPHEAENGIMQLVPNSIHNFKNLYGHNGLVSKRMAELRALQ